MNLNATLLGQMITFAVFIWFTMKYVWPPITKALDEREKKIADGLAAGERGHHDLELAQAKCVEVLKEAKDTAAHVVAEANARAAHILKEAKEAAIHEGQLMISRAEAEIAQKYNQTRKALRAETAALAIDMAEKIVKREIDLNVHKELLNETETQV
ncbi:MAG: synthase subunit [Gammaproteobacteria bacterium]|jgi:F-type H+-transporting ATPase subunit b|nr:synthase subunit [Gammaproteobacteria bacterium]